MFSLIFFLLIAAQAEAAAPSCRALVSGQTVASALTNDVVIAVIQHLAERQVERNSIKLQKMDPRFFSDLTEPIIGRQVSPITFLKQASSRFGSWDKALQAAGEDPASVRRRGIKIDLTPKMLHEILAALREQKYPLTLRAIRSMNKDSLAAITAPIAGQPLTPRMLEGEMVRAYGSWAQGLSELADSPEQVQVGKRIVWDEKLLRAILIALSVQNAALNRNSILAMDPNDFSRIAQPIVGRAVTPLAFVEAATFKYGNWDLFLSANGKEPQRIRLGPHRVSWDTDGIKKVLKQLHELGLPLRQIDILRIDTDDFAKLVRRHLGRGTTPGRFVEATLAHFDSWGEALRTAGVDPKEVENWTVRNPYYFDPEMIGYIEAESQFDGIPFYRPAIRLSSPDPDPVDNVYAQQVTRVISQSIEKLAPEDALVVREMMDVLDENPPEDLSAMSILLTDRLHRPITPHDVQEIFHLLAADPDIRALHH